VSSTASSPLCRGAGAFPATHWSVVLEAGRGDDSEARAALEILCRRYWYPIYAFVRQQGRAHHEAEDCTQEFLARLLATHGVSHARPERGRFRAFLASSLRHFLVNEWHKAQTAKRGGGATFEPLDWGDAEHRFAHEPADPGLTPEQSFDRNWALGLIDRAVSELRDEYGRSGREALFDALRPVLFGDSADESLAQQAAGLGMNVHALTMALHRLRRRLGEHLRAYVAETVGGEAEIDDELRQLMASCGGAIAAR
jgi:DNA-directed RNA polymerase specialized sigma24 family protein